jgi:excisionase family DNA binding protein
MKLLGVSRKTLCGWVRAGEIPATRIGPDNKFEPLELAHWLEERQLGPHPAVSGGGSGCRLGARLVWPATASGIGTNLRRAARYLEAETTKAMN